MRLKALDPSRRIGSLFYNPGGPADYPSNWVQAQASGGLLFSNETLEHFDLIAMDSRGLGLSSPIKCNPTIWNERVSYFPTTGTEFRTMVEHNRAFGQSCLDLTGPLFGLMDTASVARDIEAVRLALGEGPLNYLGLSYGTLIGSQYAELFPDNIRTMALDGVVDHAQSETNMFAVESSTAEDEFKRFVQWCSDTPTCALYGKNITALFASLIRRANIDPIPAPGCVESGGCRSNVTGEEILFILQSRLVLKTVPPGLNGIVGGWGDFGQALSEALTGNATLLSTPLLTTLSDSTFGGLAIECLDWTHNSVNSLSKVKYRQQLSDVLAPYTQGATQTYSAQVGCIGWPVPVANPPRRMNITNTAPILLINSEHDPECSYVWANSLMEQISNAVLLTRAGDGHTSYGLDGATTRAIDEYLVYEKLPVPNTVLDS